ncbi:putative membrane protein YphA (DoxX/SURF4 family) [Flavobacterium sp. 90]|uniref:DoxX family protein n=1 Tax=unclassified Flavobacterium TaxID=196869 RepID=UPI000EB18242|nr:MULTISPECIES: DoxX family protein [unclassified Flavobacterium]RKR04666.1 putative membrane protein YphA (DoxX/SURF4 family) [Flavobacterium sp. 81]TCK55990.1 putative membrane protein YphA (DoxX/SURF4 family) [Flavobacterium sp. 90]
MKRYQDYAVLLLRIALATGFLSAVSSRLGFWGSYSSGWESFLVYTEKVNSFVPKNFILPIAITATIAESVLGLLLFIGYQTKYVSVAAAILTFLFALAMTYSFGVKDPLDYSVFVFSMAAFLLSTMEKYQWSLDEIISKNKTN